MSNSVKQWRAIDGWSFDHLVAIGASAGGIEAVPAVLGMLPEDFLSPVVVIIHFLKNRESRFVELLQAHCALPVKEADSLEPLEPGTVYVAPRNYHLMLEDDLRFSLDIDEPVSFSRPSVDVFFASAADVLRERLTAVILTGGNGDGAKGIKKVRQMGGGTIVQDPREARFAAMPEAALQATDVDFVLPLREIAPKLVAISTKAWQRKI